MLKNINNPYAIINSYIYDNAKSYSGDKELHFIPMIQPCLDSAYLIEKNKEEYNPVAFKMHGTSSGVYPFEIPADRIAAFKKSGLPIIVHTDFSRAKTDPITEHYRASQWAKWLIKMI